jgi:hypothetical protein
MESAIQVVDSLPALRDQRKYYEGRLKSFKEAAAADQQPKSEKSDKADNTQPDTKSPAKDIP